MSPDDVDVEFVSEFLALVRRHDPTAKVRQRWGMTIVTSSVVPLHSALLVEPEYGVLAEVQP